MIRPSAARASDRHAAPAHRPEGAVKGAAASGLVQFLREWVRSPAGIGAVAPSSDALARAITAGIGPQDAPVIELGPGTGVFTAALIARGIAPDRLCLLEANARFAKVLSQRYPDVPVLSADAARLRHLSPFGAAGAGVIICGLPLVSIPRAKVHRILAGCVACLRPGGTIRLFTYGPRCPVPPAMLARLGLRAARIGFVAGNLPPASVYLLKQRTAAQSDG